jgi:hypothetical protein
MARTGFVSLLAVSLASLPVPGASQELSSLWPNAVEIEEFLKEADVTNREKIGEGVTNPEKVTLERDGTIMHAILKKVDESYDSWRFEVAAYRLDRLLELGMVPPTVPRSVGGRRGCLQLWITGVTMDEYENTPLNLELWRRQVSLMWLFDDLVANIDRHLNNAIVTRKGRLVLIDNSKTFRPFRKLLNGLNGPGTGTHAKYWFAEYDKERARYPTSYPESFIERLRALSDKQIKKALSSYIQGYAKDLVIKRRKIILERLDEMGPAVLSPRR